jgi:hypothetical protein
MNQVVTPEEMAALLEGLREVEGGPDYRRRHGPEENLRRGRVFPERGCISSRQILSNCQVALADKRWPHL